MCALMGTAKMIQKFATAKFAEHPQFSALSGPRVGVLFIVQAAGTFAWRFSPKAFDRTTDGDRLDRRIGARWILAARA